MHGKTLGICALLLLTLLGSGYAQESPPPSTGGILNETIARAESGDVAGAIARLEAERERGELAPPLRALLGTLKLEIGELEAAFDILEPLAAADSADPAVLYNAGRAALALGRTEDGERFLERSIERFPVSPAARELGLLWGLQGRTLAAYRLLRPWTSRAPEDTEARLAAALCALKLRRPNEVEQLLSDLPQDRPQVRLLWAELRLQKDDPRGALATLAPLLDDPSQGRSPEIDLDLRRTLAQAYLLTGRSADAVEQLKDVQSNDPALYLLLAQAQYQSGDPAAAAATLAPFAERALATPPEEWSNEDRRIAASISLEHGRSLVSSGKAGDSVDFLRRATVLSPWDKQAWQQLGQALAASGQREEAKVALDEFQKLAEAEASPGDRSAQLDRDVQDPTGRALREAGQWLARGEAERALSLVREEQQLVPQDLRPRFMEVQSLLFLEHHDEALAASERILELAPGNPDAVYQKGAVLMLAGDLEQAEASLRRALEISSGHVASMNDLAVLLMSQNRLDEARELLDRALVLRPEDRMAKDNLARLDELRAQ